MGRKKEPTPEPILGEEEYEVKKIVGHKFDPEDEDKVKYLYRVRWLGFTSADDTWEPKESLEGGAEVILQRYINKRKDKGFVFFKEGYRKSKVAKYLQANKVGEEVLSYDAGDEDDGVTSDEDESDEEEEEQEEEEDTEAVLRAKEKEKKKKAAQAAQAPVSNTDKEDKKRKKRESEAASAQMDEDMEDEDDRRASSKKSRRTSGSPPAMPPSLLRGREERDRLKQEKADKEKADRERAEKENAAAESSRSKKPSSKRSEEDTTSIQSKKKRRPSTATVTQESDEEDARHAKEVGDALKRSPLKEKKADQHRHSEEAASAPRSASTKVIDEPVKVSTLPAAETQANDEEEDEEDLPQGSDINRKLATWEDLLTVESLEQSSPSLIPQATSTPAPATNGTGAGPAPGSGDNYRWLVRWKSNIQAGTRVQAEEWVGNSLARRKFPQGLLSFYEDHLKFKSTPDEEEDVNAAGVNGDNDAAMD